MTCERFTSTHAGTGSLRLFMTAALCSSLCLLLVESSSVSPPTIIEPRRSQVRAAVGKPLVIPCKADPGFPDDFSLIYWLANRTFIETAYPKNNIKESEEKTYTKDGVNYIQRDLMFEKVAKKDFRSVFTCVVNNPAGIVTQTIKLVNVQRRRVLRCDSSRQ
ncbi:interleukin-1 receptor type 2-like isoform X1 [Lepisosteus oculatus]|uniref:interleukin-1 receptor type 2-like isoform X1 n=1 Tax=Lepisosteus oculatus TaxID=7918 RepID=UPI0007400EFE|nr:PREDICTED: interleukin-1 receptor type 2-like isoform X1 [Lepisosteus oculatus]